ncbi:MAG: glutathione peroxidase [Chitinophagaceae bacterium]
MIILLKKASLVIVMFIIAFGGYVLIINRNAVNMTGRQKLLKAVYPVLTWINKLTNKNMEAFAPPGIVPPVSFYTLKAVLNDGSTLDMTSLKGKKILLVNTASDCGYTGQYDQLQQLYSQYNTSLVVIGFPANDFKEQEKGTDSDIAAFCKKNYGVTFPLVQKSTVIKSTDQNAIFQWLSDPAKNGWNSNAPSWNFCKYLVNEEGALTAFFSSGIDPMGEEMTKAIR